MVQLVRDADLGLTATSHLVMELGHGTPERIDDVLSGLDPGERRQAAFGFALGQERLLRHHDLGEPGRLVDEAARPIVGSAAWLPPTLHRWEVDLRTCMPYGGPHRTKRAKPTLSPPIARGGLTLGQVLEEHELTVGVFPPEMSCRIAHERMVLKSNGMIDTALFDRDRRGSNRAWEEVLGSDAVAVEISTWAALSYFFSTALSPGAYTHRIPGWRCRLAMGQALAGWVAADLTDSFTDVLDSCGDHRWFRIEPESEWFCHVAWDSAMLCVGNDRAVLLWATDTD